MADCPDQLTSHCSNLQFYKTGQGHQSMNYFLVFLQSNILEFPVFLPYLMRERTLFQSMALVTCLNAITHPIVFFFIMNLKMTFLFNILAAETFAVLAEAYAMSKITGDQYRTSLVISFCANFLSWQLSPMITFALHQ